MSEQDHHKQRLLEPLVLEWATLLQKKEEVGVDKEKTLKEFVAVKNIPANKTRYRELGMVAEKAFNLYLIAIDPIDERLEEIQRQIQLISRIDTARKRIEPNRLTPNEAATACHLWAWLMTGEPAAREQLAEAPANIQAAIAAASKRALEGGDEPEGDNPFG